MNLLLVTSFFITLALGVPIALCLALTSLAALIFIGDIPLYLIPQRMFTGMDSFPLMAVPFFILAGDIMNSTGITASIVRFATVLVGHIRGGLAHVNIVASMFFAGISGSAVADTAAMGSIMIPAMEEDGYSLEFSSAVTASSSVIGPIIPPSIPVVIYAMVGSVSVGGLFLAGVMPGILIGLGLMAVSYVQARRFGFGTQRPLPSPKEVLTSARGAFIPLMMPIIILGGILSGVFTATEAAAVAVAYAIVIGFFVLNKLTLKEMPQIFFKSMVTTSTILLVMACANIFSWILSTQQIPQALGSAVSSVTNNPLVLLLLINIILFVVGCFLEGIAAIIIMVPILLPLSVQAGIDPVHFGIVVIMNLMIGLITPPLGLCLFVVCSVAKVNFIKVVKATFPFLLVEIAALLVITYFPDIALFVPRYFGF